MNMTRAFKANQLKSLSWQEANAILSDFDVEKHRHVNDKIIDSKGGEIYIFYSLDEDKWAEYSADGYLWKNMGANKPAPINYPVLTKSYNHIKIKRTDDEEAKVNIYMSMFLKNVKILILGYVY